MGRGANDEKLITAHHIVARRVFGVVPGNRRDRGVPLILLITWAYLDRGLRATLGTVLRLFRVIHYRRIRSLSHLFFSPFHVPLSFNGGPYGEVICFVCARSALLRDNYDGYTASHLVTDGRFEMISW